MKTILNIAVLLTLLFVISSCDTTGYGGGTVKLETKQDSISYFIGTDMATSLVDVKDEISLEVLISGLRHQLSAEPLLVNKEEMQNVMREFSTKVRKKMEEKKKAALTENKEKGAMFLQENKKKDGVITTESGLQYEVVTQGDGPKPTTKDKVKVHYRGTTTDGTEFDSSYKRGEPATFPVTGVIKGWTEALLLMNVGSKFNLCVPSELAYGERGAGRSIGPNAVLLFEVELLGIE